MLLWNAISLGLNVALEYRHNSTESGVRHFDAIQVKRFVNVAQRVAHGQAILNRRPHRPKNPDTRFRQLFGECLQIRRRDGIHS